MSLNRYNAKRDEFEKIYVDLFERAGLIVERISSPGHPDLIVGRKGYSPVFVEVKTAKNKDQACKMRTKKQVEFFERWDKILCIMLIWDINSAMDVVKFFRQIKNN